jgi:hypothetical protein
MLRVKYGAWAPLRFSNMLSRPATGINYMVTINGVTGWIILGPSLSDAVKIPFRHRYP